MCSFCPHSEDIPTDFYLSLLQRSQLSLWMLFLGGWSVFSPWQLLKSSLFFGILKFHHNMSERGFLFISPAWGSWIYVWVSCIISENYHPLSLQIFFLLFPLTAFFYGKLWLGACWTFSVWPPCLLASHAFLFFPLSDAFLHHIFKHFSFRLLIFCLFSSNVFYTPSEGNPVVWRLLFSFTQRKCLRWSILLKPPGEVVTFVCLFSDIYPLVILFYKQRGSPVMSKEASQLCWVLKILPCPLPLQDHESRGSLEFGKFP